MILAPYGRRRGVLPAIAALIVALLAVAALQRLVPVRPAEMEGAPSAVARPVWGPPDYGAALHALDRQVARERAGVAADPDAWMPREALAMALHARGQLTGSHDDLAAALAEADRSRALAPGGSGPVLARAIVALALHHNPVAAEEVARMPGFAIAAEPADRAEAEAILGDVALYAGDYPAALARYDSAAELWGGPGVAVRRADWKRHRGEFAAARAELSAALANGGGGAPWNRAALLLQLGAIDLQAGDWTGAERRFAEADTAFPGWWLARAHRAQIAAVRGDWSRAEALYREAMAGAERPSVMEALAAVLREQGRERAAAALETRAGALWRAYAASHPEAYADHAFEAALREGDTARAWRLARYNYRTRPYGDARIGLARAAAARDRDASARAILVELERTGWRSTEQYRVLADVCARLRDRACVSDARKKALALSPRAFDPRADLLFFGNH